jgi:aryl-alcohol dehydrogenase-like predicted oxidoreductase
MLRRQLGRSGIQVRVIGLGCSAIGGPWTFRDYPGSYGEVDDTESIRSIHCALNLDVNFFDTAANYGCGHSDQVLDQAIGDRRDKVVIATKFGYLVDEESKSVSDNNDDDVVSAIRDDCEASLRRLNTDYIDLYQFHRYDHPIDLAVEVRDVLEELTIEGKIRYYGWSTDDIERARIFAEGEHCCAIQHHINVIYDAPEMLAVCDELALGSINRSPLGSGLLTGKYKIDTKFSENDYRRSAYIQEEWLLPILEGLDSVREILTSGGRTLVQGALAWILSRSKRTIPTPGFKTVEQVKENVLAMDLGSLSDEQMQQINELLGRSQQ